MIKPDEGKRSMDKPSGKRQLERIAMGIPIGVGGGVALGVTLGDIGAGIAIGSGIDVLIGLVIERSRKE